MGVSSTFLRVRVSQKVPSVRRSDAHAGAWEGVGSELRDRHTYFDIHSLSHVRDPGTEECDR